MNATQQLATNLRVDGAEKLSFDEVLAAVADGATIGGCADIMISNEFIGYPADDVGPEDCGVRRVSEIVSFDDDGWPIYGREVLVPCAQS